MGIYLAMEDSSFTMKSENKDKALKAIKNLMKKANVLGNGGSYDGKKWSEKWFSWVNTKGVLECKTFEDAMLEWGYEIRTNDAGDVINIQFSGEKLGQEEHMFKAIAPYVNDGSYIDVEIENEHWRWAFKNGKYVELQGKVVYEE